MTIYVDVPMWVLLLLLALTGLTVQILWYWLRKAYDWMWDGMPRRRADAPADRWTPELIESGHLLGNYADDGRTPAAELLRRAGYAIAQQPTGRHCAPDAQQSAELTSAMPRQNFDHEVVMPCGCIRLVHMDGEPPELIAPCQEHDIAPAAAVGGVAVLERRAGVRLTTLGRHVLAPMVARYRLRDCPLCRRPMAVHTYSAITGDHSACPV